MNKKLKGTKNEILRDAYNRLTEMRFQLRFYTLLYKKTDYYTYNDKAEKLVDDIKELKHEIRIFEGGE